MLIGINASSAMKENPTGVEEYTYQLVMHLAMIPESRAHRFILYLNSRLASERLRDFEKLPENFELRFLSFPFLWTQIRLAWEMLNSRIDVLFIPVHILPFMHPKRSIVALHGLEYEFFPEMYPLLHRMYLRWSTKCALKNASKIIAVSENTRQDLVKLYGGDPDKIGVVHHGIEKVSGIKYQVLGMKKDDHFSSLRGAENEQSRASGRSAESGQSRGSYRNNFILYIGRLELKKNLLGIVEAYNKFRTLNAECQTKLVLAGGRGFGWKKIDEAILRSKYKNDIVLKGYVAEEEKNNLLKNAAIFIYPSFYEGFGMPILEAQAAGVPVVVSNVSSMPEVAGAGAVLVDPRNTEEIAGVMVRILNDEKTRRALIEKGFQNAVKFSWEKCARETLKILTK